MLLHREKMIERLDDGEPFDVAVVGGGATGLGAALDAASRGYRTCLFERGDFACATSSRSTKLIHGGVRYLAQGDLSLVRESLRERGRLLRNAPHLVGAQRFIVPTYSGAGNLYYLAGLRAYDLLAGRLGIGSTRRLSRDATIRALPTVRADRLTGGVAYFDGQFDDALLAVRLAQTAAQHGAVVINYMNVVALDRRGDRIAGVVVHDVETGAEHTVAAKGVINAAGVFADRVRRLDEPDAEPTILPSRGSHIVLDRSFLPGDAAMMIPKTDDKRVLFAIPWRERLMVGTTDVPAESVDGEPRPSEEELSFLLDHGGRYLTRAPQRGDVLSMFAGLRPLARPSRAKGDTSAVSRDHGVSVAPSGLVSVTGGKWTTYRRMAEDAVDTAQRVAGLPDRPCRTAGLAIVDPPAPAERGAKLHDRLPYDEADVRTAVESEMARTVEDGLSRRTRALLLDARASIDIAPRVAAIMAEMLERDEAWQREQVEQYRQLARHYLP